MYHVQHVKKNPDGGFDVGVITEVANPHDVSPPLSPCFHTREDAEKCAAEEGPKHLAAELHRLRDAGPDEYRAHRGLEAYHKFLKANEPAAKKKAR